MSLPVLRVAVAGHTNTGKTSLMRTLIRDAGFGTVSDRPATTRRVETASLVVDGAPLVDLFDTPGLEDSSGLIELLDRMRSNLGLDWIEAIGRFLDSEEAARQYSQEAKALAQVLRSDMVLYVIDARDRVLGKHRDELEILGRTGIPVVPVLNFTASPEARTQTWREQLARVNMHAVAEFDTVVLDIEGEHRLYETIKVLAGRFRPTVEAVVADLGRRRGWLTRASAELLADLLIDAAARVIHARRDDPDRVAQAVESLKEEIRTREQGFVDAVLALHRFRPDDYAYARLPVSDGQWGTDLFNPEALRQFGIRAGSAAAAGAVAGLAIDAMLGGMTLGGAAATGAAVGALYGVARDKGRDLVARYTGYSALRVDDATLTLIAVRNAALIDALFRRGHASQQPMRINHVEASQGGSVTSVVKALSRCRAHPEWSRIGAAGPVEDPARTATRDAIADRIGSALETRAGNGGA
jgi:small GTP-binding protein